MRERGMVFGTAALVVAAGLVLAFGAALGASAPPAQAASSTWTCSEVSPTSNSDVAGSDCYGSGQDTGDIFSGPAAYRCDSFTGQGDLVFGYGCTRIA